MNADVGVCKDEEVYGRCKFVVQEYSEHILICDMVTFKWSQAEYELPEIPQSWEVFHVIILYL